RSVAAWSCGAWAARDGASPAARAMARSRFRTPPPFPPLRFGEGEQKVFLPRSASGRGLGGGVLLSCCGWAGRGPWWEDSMSLGTSSAGDSRWKKSTTPAGRGGSFHPAIRPILSGYDAIRSHVLQRSGRRVASRGPGSAAVQAGDRLPGAGAFRRGLRGSEGGMGPAESRLTSHL